MEILLLEPYYTGSHRAWVDGYIRHSRFSVRTLLLPGRFWKWRMHGGAVTLAGMFNETDYHPDVILATDMVDLTTFLSLTRKRTHSVPTALYFHENQLTYPLRRGEKRDLHYGFIHYASALSADVVFFNSQFHLADFYEELPWLLKHFPDYNELQTIDDLRAKSQVLPLGLELQRHDRYQNVERTVDEPVIVWNHRWEYDKNPKEFFQALYALKGMGLAFKLVLLGESFRIQPEEFLQARDELADHILWFGYAPDFSTYSAWLWRADLCVSTAHHEFFGIATAEAIYCRCYPILPNRLVYPELIPASLHGACLYGDFDGLLGRLQAYLRGERPSEEELNLLRDHVRTYDWSEMAAQYDRRLEEIHAQRRHQCDAQ